MRCIVETFNLPVIVDIPIAIAQADERVAAAKILEGVARFQEAQRKKSLA